jgi:hypothetical protein
MATDGKDAIKQDLGIRFNRMLNGLLSNLELVCKNEFQYSATRKKVLRLVNDTLRDISVDIDRKYQVEMKEERREEFFID